jgi:hypothetical protein
VTGYCEQRNQLFLKKGYEFLSELSASQEETFSVELK